MYAAVSGAGAALGLLLGGILTNYLSWRWVLFVNVPIGVVLITGAFLYLHQSERLRGRFDFVGAALSVGRPGRHGVRLHPRRAQRLEQRPDLSWCSSRPSSCSSSFVYYEAKVATEPMMPMRIFENRNRSGTYLIMFVVGAAMFGMFYFVTFFVQGVREYGPLKTGVSFLPVAFVIGIVSQIMAQLLPKVGPEAADDHRHRAAHRVAAVVLDGRQVLAATRASCCPA